MDVQLAGELAPQNGFKLGQWEIKIKLLYDYTLQVMLIQHDDPNKSASIFQNQQRRVEDLTGVLWQKKLFGNKNRNWSATGTEQEENYWMGHSGPEGSSHLPWPWSFSFQGHICGKCRRYFFRMP